MLFGCLSHFSFLSINSVASIVFSVQLAEPLCLKSALQFDDIT